MAFTTLLAVARRSFSSLQSFSLGSCEGAFLLSLPCGATLWPLLLL